MPGLPEEQVQLNSNGISGDLALVDGYIIYRWVKEIYEAYNGTLSSCNAVLDFGCGWGRVVRFFLKDLELSQLWGVDHYDKVLEFCKQTNKWCNFERIDSFPPTSFADNTFDLIFSYSVFSHLSEEAHQKWLREFSRILKAGGILLATTWERDLILRCAQMRANPNLPFFQKHLPTLFVNTEKVLADYDNGRFCFDSSVESYGDISYFLGEACISKGYVLDHWTKLFYLPRFHRGPVDVFAERHRHEKAVTRSKPTIPTTTMTASTRSRPRDGNPSWENPPPGPRRRNQGSLRPQTRKAVI